MEIAYSYFVPIAVQEQTQAGAARREAARIAAKEGLNEHDSGRLSIVVTEAANNLIKHGRGGEILLSINNGSACVDMLALDKGKGMHSVEECMRDGYSTAGTPGTGLGAMQRLSELFEVFSVPGTGTVVHCRVGSSQDKPPRTAAAARMDFGALSVPITGETRCGDGWAELHTHTHSVYMVVDGLGHGAGAAEAAEEAVIAFHRIAATDPVDVLDEVHHSLRKTRGAAVSVASLDHVQRKVLFAGIGNVSGVVIASSRAQSMVSHNGIAGHTAGRFQNFTYEWPSGSMLVMYSDGVASHWNLATYPGMQSRSPLLSAAVLYRDYSRRRDDATLLVARERMKK